MSNSIKITSKSAFKVLFIKHYAPLVLFANKYLTNTSASEDVVQDIFIELWKSKRTFTDEQHLNAFLLTTVKNKCLNVLNHQKVRDNYISTVLKSTNTLENELEELQHKSYIKTHIYNAIKTLSPRKQEVIKLMVKGLRNQEIADRMEIKLQTVKTLKSQAYEQLRKILNEK